MVTIATDNRWGRVKWGQTKWGPSGAVQILAWGIEVDWNGDGVFDGNESDHLVGITGFRGRTDMLQASGSGFEPLQSGKFELTLDNEDGRYNAWNSSSSLYPNVTYGKDVRIRVRDMSGAADPYPVFYGIITDIVPYQDFQSNARVKLVVEDSWIYLRNNKPRVAVQTSIATDAAIAAVLSSINWPARWGSDLGVASDVPTYFWAPSDENAGTTLENLANSGLSAFWISARGKATYRFRSNIPVATLAITQDILLKDLSVMQPWLNQRNVVRLTINPRSQAASGVIWQLTGTAPSLAAGASMQFFAPYTYNNQSVPATNVLQPVATTDWTTNTLADGTGTDKTANCSLAITDFGDLALVTVTNNSGVVVYLTKAQIKGKAIYITNTIDVTYPSDATTVTNPREFKQDLLWQQDINVALGIVGVLGPFFATRFPVITCKIEGRPSQQFLLELFDSVTVTFPALGLNGQAFRVAGIGIDSQDEGCQDVVTTLLLEPYPVIVAGGVWDSGMFDTAVFGW